MRCIALNFWLYYMDGNINMLCSCGQRGLCILQVYERGARVGLAAVARERGTNDMLNPIRPISVDVQSAGLIGRTDIGLIGCMATGQYPQNSHRDYAYKPGAVFPVRHPFPPPSPFVLYPPRRVDSRLPSFFRSGSLSLIEQPPVFSPGGPPAFCPSKLVDLPSSLCLSRPQIFYSSRWLTSPPSSAPPLFSQASYLPHLAPTAPLATRLQSQLPTE